MRQDERQDITERSKKEQQRCLTFPGIALDNHIETIDVIENACQTGRALSKMPVTFLEHNIRGVAHALEGDLLPSGGLGAKLALKIPMKSEIENKKEISM
jgi:hypothetical protein